VTALNDMYGWVKGIKGFFEDIGNMSFWTKLTQLSGMLGLNSTPESMGIIPKGSPDFNKDTGSGSAATQALAGGMFNTAAMRQQMTYTGDIQSKVFGDTSHGPPPPDAAAAAVTAYSRAEDSLRKYILTSDAAASSVNNGIYEQERLKAIAELTAAGIRDKLTPETAKMNAELSKTPDLAAKAALGLAKANTEANIKFGRETSFLSADDVAIAQQLKGQYDSVGESLNSMAAVALRTNGSLKPLKKNDTDKKETDVELDHRSKAA
jgi:hypothetical protein